MRIAVLGSSDSWYFQDLLRAAAGRHELVALPWTRLRAHLGASGQSVWSREAQLKQFDAVLVRSMPKGSLEQVVFRMNVLAVYERTAGLVVNSARSLEVAIDKYLALSRLQQAGFLVPDTLVCQSPVDVAATMEALGDDVVAKPLFGGEGRGVVRLCAGDWQQQLNQLASDAVYYLQRYISHTAGDLRLLTIGDRVLGMRRQHPDDWRTNVSLGADCRPLEVTSELGELAQRATAAVGASICAVDLLPADDGQLYALEVNAVPGWRALASTTHIDVAQLVLEHLVELGA